MNNATMTRDEAATLYRDMRSVAVREYGYTADEFDQCTRGLGTTPADFVRAAELLLEHARENRQPLLRLDDGTASCYVEELREELAGMERALNATDSNGIPVLDCGKTRNRMSVSIERLRDQIECEEMLNEHNAEPRTFRSWA